MFVLQDASPQFKFGRELSQEPASSSSSVNVVVMTSEGENFSAQQTVSSGSCLKLTGTWSNPHYTPDIAISCDAIQGGYRGIRITYGNNTWTGTDNIKQYLGVHPYYTAESVTFVENVCVYSTDGGGSVKCKFDK